MAKEALYLVHAELDGAWAADWNVWHAREHVPLVVKQAGFLGASRMRHVKPNGDPLEPPRYTTVYRAPGLGRVREYLEGGEVGKMRAHHDAWLANRRARLSREVLEENHSVGSDGKQITRGPELNEGRAAFVVRVRLDPEIVPEWSTWYDRDHMPRVVEKGGFLRAGRWRIVEEGAGTRFAVIYEAPQIATVSAFRGGPGPAFAEEHEKKFGSRVTIEREFWSAA